MTGQLEWIVSVPTVTDAYGSPVSGRGESPDEALTNLVAAVNWQLKLAEEKREKVNELVEAARG